MDFKLFIEGHENAHVRWINEKDLPKCSELSGISPQQIQQMVAHPHGGMVAEYDTGAGSEVIGWAAYDLHKDYIWITDLFPGQGGMAAHALINKLSTQKNRPYTFFEGHLNNPSNLNYFKAYGFGMVGNKNDSIWMGFPNQPQTKQYFQQMMEEGPTHSQEPAGYTPYKQWVPGQDED